MGTAQVQGSLWGARARDYASIAEGCFRPVYETVFAEAGVGAGTKLLDVGCGPGLAAQLAAKRGAHIASLDAAEASLAIARERTPAGDFRAGEMEDLPWPDNTFDVVTSFNAFQYAADLMNALREARRVAKPEGRVAMAVWGRAEDCETVATVTALSKLLPPPPPGAPGPFALSTSSHYIHQPGVARLKCWGLLDKVVESNCPPARQISLDVGHFTLVGTPPPADGVACGYAPRRRVLDAILVEAAVATGAEVREHFAVNELLMDGERVMGVRGHAIGGAMVTEQARIVIGADGLRSFVARSVQAPTYHVRPTFNCAYYTYWSDVPLQGAELYPRPDRMIIAAPTNDGQIVSVMSWPNVAFHDVRADVEGHFMQALDLAPGLAERVRNGRRAERFHGTADLPNFYRKPYGPGWALVGDAGYHKDPITAFGISDAFRDAELLAEAIDEGLSGRCALGDALADYERWRNNASMPLFELTCQLATLQPPAPEQQQLFAALQHDQEQTNRFCGTIAGTVPIAEFFAPENLGRIMGAGAQVAGV